MTINELVRKINKLIGYEKADILVQYVLEVDKKYLLINKDEEVKDALVKKCIEFAKKVQKGYPVQYITNKAYFMGLEFFVNEDVLIPQPDTEVVVMQVLNEIERIRKKENKKIRILDLCTGSGVIAISIASKTRNVEILATDKSIKALEVAKKNYENIIKNPIKKSKTNKNNVKALDENIVIENDRNSKIDFLQSDMFKNIDEKDYDIIVSNPPYIETEVIKTLDIEVQNEPEMALDGGKDGLDFYKIIKENVGNYLKKDGLLVLEIGYNQKDKLQELFEKAECVKDFANNDRVIIWRM